MGLFKKKSKTEVKTEVTETVLTKIVKLSYIQSLAVNGGVADPRSLVGETKADSVTLNSDSLDRDRLSKLRESTGSFGGLLEGGSGVSRAINSLFGKKVKSNTSVTVEDSGWTLVKTWAQPQFDILRYCLGIKELSASQFTYVSVSEIVSKPWSSPKEINKVTLTVDQFIPSQFPPGIYIEYYIKPDIENSDWIRINPLGVPTQFTDQGTIVPRIITFNTDKPASSNIEQSYINTSVPVKSVRFKALLKRPEDLITYTPVLRSYRMIFTIRNGL